MATKYSDNYTLLNNVPSEKIDVASAAKIKALYAEYTLTADLAAADVIKMFPIPKGARIVGMAVDFPDLDASGGTIDIGWSASADGSTEAGDADGLAAVVDVTSAIKKDGIAAGLPGFGKKFAADVDFQLTINGDTDATSGTIKAALFVVID